jgi:hypothetical protein
VERAPVVYVDESGNSGQNLLDARQPVFILAAVHLEEVDARELASVLAGDAEEGHYTRLRKQPSGQQRILRVLADERLGPASVRVIALHKPFMAVAKLVDLLIEPVVAAAGHDLYADGWHLKLSHVLQDLGRQACPQHWQPLLSAFVRFVWRGTTAGAAELVHALSLAVEEAGDHPVGDFLQLVPRDSDLLLAWHGREEHEESADALDPALTAMVEQTISWGQRLGPFLLVYDENKLVGRWTQRLLAMSDPQVAADHNVTPSNKMPVLPLAGLSPATSYDSPAVQVADCLAGACADVLRSRVLGDDPTDWRLALRQARVLRFVDHITWPHDAAVAEEFELQGCYETS